MGTLRAFEARYDIRLNFSLSANSGQFIHSVLFYHAREFLLKGIAV